MNRAFLVDWTSRQYQALEKDILLAPHRLHESGLFDDDQLATILDRHPTGDLNINTMGTDPEQFEWREGDRNGANSELLLDLVRRGRLWLNVRNVMKHHPQLRDAVNSLYDDLERKSPGFKADHRSANLLISSPTALVYFHLDVPINMLWHIRGQKRVWVYPIAEHVVSQRNLEAVCAKERVEELPYDQSLDQYAQVFDVLPGQMLTWPQHAPHRVTNLSGLNVSLSTEHMNRRGRRRVRVNEANRLVRRTLGWQCRSRAIDGPAAHLKELLVCAGKAYNKTTRKPGKKGNLYPVSFRVDADAPLGYTLLEDTGELSPVAALA